MSGDPVLEQVRAIEDDFADAMSRMYGVGNELARLRAHLATEASPEHWTRVASPEVPPSPSPVATAPAAAPVAPGHVTPPPRVAPPMGPSMAPPPSPPLPPTEPWWQRDGIIAKALAAVGAAITLIGVAFLLALAIQLGFFGPLARVISGGLLSLALVGAAALVRSRQTSTVGALGLAATGIATAYLDVLAVTYVYAWVPLGVGLVLAGLIALGGVLLARVWDSQLLAVIAVLGVALMAPFVGVEHGLLTGGFLLVLTAATWPAQIGRDWWALELSRVIPTALFLTALAVAHDEQGIAAALAIAFALLVMATTLAGARVGRLPDQLGLLVPVGIGPLWFAGMAFDGRWTGTGLLVIATCLLVLVAGLVGHDERTALVHRVPELALAAAGVTSLTAAVRGADGNGWTPVVGLALCLLWAVAALVLRHRTTLFVSWALSTLGLIGATTLLPHVALRSLADQVGPTHLLATVLLVATLTVTARASHVLVPDTSPVLPRILVALSVLVTGGAVVLLGALVGQLVDDARGGYTAGQAGATVVWMATAAVLLLRGLRGSTIAVPAGLGLAALSVGKLLLFDLSFLSGLARVLCFIVAGLILLGMGAGYAQALERSRRGGGGPGTGPTPPVDNPAAPVPVPPTV